MKYASILLLAFCCISCAKSIKNPPAIDPTSLSKEKEQIVLMLDSFNKAAASASFDRYFQFFTDSATFDGTDATEHWNKAAFMVWAKPYFDKKRTWDFTAISRHIYFGQHPDLAWLDELLNTHMKICRGSGVVVKQNNQWKVQQYVLSMTIPNAHIDAILKIKSATEDSLMQAMKAAETIDR